MADDFFALQRELAELRASRPVQAGSNPLIRYGHLEAVRDFLAGVDAGQSIDPGRAVVLLRSIVQSCAAPQPAVPQWMPIESAPEGVLVVVMWSDPEVAAWCHNFDYFEEGVWQNYFNEHEHYAIAGVAKGRSEDAPYQFWTPLPGAAAPDHQEPKA